QERHYARTIARDNSNGDGSCGGGARPRRCSRESAVGHGVASRASISSMSTRAHHERTSGTKAAAASRIDALSLPRGLQRNDRDWPAVSGLAVYHLLVLLAFLPWFFSWTGLVLGALGLYLYGTLGINLCYHRILTHRGLRVPKWLERIFATLGVCCLEDTPARWIAV